MKEIYKVIYFDAAGGKSKTKHFTKEIYAKRFLSLFMVEVINALAKKNPDWFTDARINKWSSENPVFNNKFQVRKSCLNQFVLLEEVVHTLYEDLNIQKHEHIQGAWLKIEVHDHLVAEIVATEKKEAKEKSQLTNGVDKNTNKKRKASSTKTTKISTKVKAKTKDKPKSRSKYTRASDDENVEKKESKPKISKEKEKEKEKEEKKTKSGTKTKKIVNEESESSDESEESDEASEEEESDEEEVDKNKKAKVAKSPVKAKEVADDE